MSETKYTAADYKSGQPRWCPGCGDHAFLNSFHKALAELGVPPHEIAVISGIGNYTGSRRSPAESMAGHRCRHGTDASLPADEPCPERIA